MRKTIDLVKNDADVHITSITLHGYASPDGSYANNEKLAKNRTKAVYDYLRNLYPVERNCSSSPLLQKTGRECVTT